IIGAGPVGLEMGQAHRRLGGQVTVIEGARALGREDPEAAALVLAQLRGEGVEVLEGAEVVRVAAEGDGVRVTLADGRELAGTHLLIAAGRKPNLAGLNPEAAGIAHTAAGVTVNDALRTSNRRVYAIGDVAGRGQFTHLAGYHAGVVIRAMLFGLPARVRADHIPRVTYTDPELAQIGLTEVEARERHGKALEVIRLGLDGNDRAITEGVAAGFIKLMVHKGRAEGVTLAGPGAGEQVGIWALMLANRGRLSVLAGTVLPYPTLNETSKRAASAYFSPRLFDNPVVKRVVGLVQRLVF
ncbi:MAG TPA: FAD-dependent oxidoreductase, partial [Paracoccus sp.]|nr:FAD-dependent oxidoreductase [Paracoccus sp. (in: a-proteobacteria)]